MHDFVLFHDLAERDARGLGKGVDPERLQDQGPV